MKDLRRTVLVMLLSMLMVLSNAQSWKENTGTSWEFDMSGISVLVVIYEGFNYEEAYDITDYWRSWGAVVDIAGTLPEQHGERNNPVTRKVHDEVPVTVRPDLLIEDADLNKYDLIYFPGGEGVAEFKAKYGERLRKMIDNTVRCGKYVAAICHSPYLLSVSEMVAGRSITVQGNEFKPELTRAGAKIVNEVFIADGRFLTGQWPFFETFATSVARELTGSAGNVTALQQLPESYPGLRSLGKTRSVWYMKNGGIAEDTLKLIINSCINPQLPMEMMNNSTLRIIAVKDTVVKSLLADAIVEAGKEQYRQANVSGDVMKSLWLKLFNAPYLIFVYNDLSDISSVKDDNEKALLTRLNTVLAGESVSQLIIAARALGYETSTLGGMRTFIAEEGFRTVLGLPADYRLANIIGIGRPRESGNPPVARPLNEYLIIR